MASATEQKNKSKIKDVLIRPIITEKSTGIASELQKYTFEVAKWANKYQVKEAIEIAFPKVKVKKINIATVFGSSKRTAKGVKSPRDSKKAIVTIEGPHIEYFPEL